jgi:hypothetical protein
MPDPDTDHATRQDALFDEVAKAFCDWSTGERLPMGWLTRRQLSVTVPE